MPHNRRTSGAYWPLHHIFDRTPVSRIERVGVVLFIIGFITGVWALLFYLISIMRVL